MRKDKDWRSRLVLPEERERLVDGSASAEDPRYYKSKDPADQMIHVELGAGWVNYNYGGRVLARDNHRFPPENLGSAFEEIDEAEVERIAPAVLPRVGCRDAEPALCPKCEGPMAAGWFEIHGDLVGFLIAGLSAPQGLWFKSFDVESAGTEVEVVGRSTSSAEGWRCPECGLAIVMGMHH